MARKVTYEETVQLLRKCNEDGLVPTLNISDVIGNCCEDCCAMFYGHKSSMPIFIASPFVAQADEQICNACHTCADRCPVNAIEVGEFAIIDASICLGCGA
jgi:heterodisulfide reductase subunit A-like polyferredoxin